MALPPPLNSARSRADAPAPSRRRRSRRDLCLVRERERGGGCTLCGGPHSVGRGLLGVVEASRDVTGLNPGAGRNGWDGATWWTAARQSALQLVGHHEPYVRCCQRLQARPVSVSVWRQPPLTPGRPRWGAQLDKITAAGGRRFVLGRPTRPPRASHGAWRARRPEECLTAPAPTHCSPQRGRRCRCGRARHCLCWLRFDRKKRKPDTGVTPRDFIVVVCNDKVLHQQQNDSSAGTMHPPPLGPLTWGPVAAFVVPHFHTRLWATSPAGRDGLSLPDPCASEDQARKSFPSPPGASLRGRGLPTVLVVRTSTTRPVRGDARRRLCPD